jgi:hypothetical protein
VTEHERAPETDHHGRPYCLHCGFLESMWPLNETCNRKPVLSVVPPEDLSEADRFMADPLAWLQEWNDKNGKVSHEKLELGYAAYLWVEGHEIPFSTGVAPSLPHAFRNAIKGLDGIKALG